MRYAPSTRGLCALIFGIWLAAAGLVPSAGAVTITFRNGSNVVSSDNMINIPNYMGTEDTEVNGNLPRRNRNYGGHIDLQLGEITPNDDFSTYICFDVSALANKYAQINSVALRLYKYTDLGAISDRRVDLLVVDPADADWVEGNGLGTGSIVNGAATFNERQHSLVTPWSGNETLALSSYVLGPGNAYEHMALNATLINLTDLIDDWVVPSQNGGLHMVLTNPVPATRYFTFASRNNPTLVEAVPELFIDYTPVPEPACVVLFAFAAAAFSLCRRSRSAHRG